MFNNFFRRFFSRPSFGLDISDRVLKFTELISTKEGAKVGRHGQREIPVGVIESGEIKDGKKFEEILKSLKKNFGLKSARISLPNEYMRNIKDYLMAFRNSRISVKSFESKAQALSRSIFRNGDMGTHLVIDLGKNYGAIFIVSDGVVVSHTTLEFDEISDSILRDKVAKHFLHWHTYKDEEGKNNSPIQKIILCGDNSDLAKLAEYLSVGLRNKVELANVWINVLDTQKFVPPINFKQSLGFASALGLALKDF